MRASFHILFFLLPFFAFSQKVNDVNPVFENSRLGVIKTEANGYYLSGDLTNGFTDKFIKGGLIDSTLKSNILSELKDENRFGAEQNSGLSWFGTETQFFGKPHWGWSAGISQHDYFNFSFGRNLFELAFFGNSDFAGDTVQLAPMNISRWRFQKVKVGAFHKDNFSSVSIGFIKAENFLEMNLHDARLYTESNGMELNLALSEEMYRSDTNKLGLSAFNGWGLCTDITINLNAGENKNVRFSDPIRISLENFGFVQWNENTIHRKTDTSIHYEGFEVMDLLNNENSPFTDFELEDSLTRKGKKESILRLLPFTFSVTRLTDIRSDAKWQSFYGFRLRAVSNYRPMIFAGLQFRPVKSFTSSVYGAFGGYGGFRAGVILTCTIADWLYVNTATGNITGWFLPKAYGKDLSIGLSVNIR